MQKNTVIKLSLQGFWGVIDKKKVKKRLGNIW